MYSKLKVLIVGCGNMGSAHARAYTSIRDFEIVGLVSRGRSKEDLNLSLNANYPLFSDYYLALHQTKPDAVCISTYPDTHESYAVAAFESGAHVFLEKPIADTVIGAQRVIDAAKRANKKLVVGYILRHHPSWIKFIEYARNLGAPLVMRMNLNQQSQGNIWNVHRNLMKTLSPIVDCGVHYIDIMCQITDAQPIKVSAMGVRMTNEIPMNNYNYGQLQIYFDDNSVGWYEAGWGPMISETASFIKDIVGPNGSVSLVSESASKKSIESHVTADFLRIHFADIDDDNKFVHKDEYMYLHDDPDHQELCKRQQEYFLCTIRNDIDLSKKMQDAFNSLKIALACDESIKTGRIVYLNQDN